MTKSQVTEPVHPQIEEGVVELDPLSDWVRRYRQDAAAAG